MAVGEAGDDAEGIEHRHRRQIGQAHHHHLPQLEGFAQLRFARRAAVDGFNRHGISLLVLCCQPCNVIQRPRGNCCSGGGKTGWGQCRAAGDRPVGTAAQANVCAGDD